MKKETTQNEKPRIQFLHKLFYEDKSFYNDLSMSNYFIINFPESLNIRTYDAISVEFKDDNKCKIVIRNNFTNFPLFALSVFNKRQCSFWKKKKEDIIIDHLDKNGEIRYKSILKNIKICNIKESELTYLKSSIQTITFDVIFKKRILEKIERQ